MSQHISANFAGVEDGARQIIKRAEGIRDELEAFHKKVEEFVTTNWKGATNEAFAQLQRTWQQNVDQLNTTLAGAGQLVSSGNSELQSTDSALANLF
ncbi:WXG100 family type VII secretion target [Nocardia farcinica]|nr:WXG100 family type VII secretion target [Nocardia farcinica]MBF6138554.1 WXG100 family type VII secretion target [Nocardia farcinica]MBF6361273.1 WXG100 family type VII secretion target [Nocardia farcinica]MBF6386716.1 WXG100 family type VII secretion target [Nocardia farcinica]MBF6537515.1 WXG100 family type VII secretion target [Nocardia farcinica]